MKNNEQLFKDIIKENPDLPIQFMYCSENGNSDYTYTGGNISKVEIDELYIDEDRIWFAGSDTEELEESLMDEYFFELFPEVFNSTTEYLSTEQDKMIENKVKEHMKNIQWEKAIIVHID